MPATITAPVDGQLSSPRSPLMVWLAVVSVMLGIFAIVTTEILPIGLLTSIGTSFGVSDGMAGLMMTMPGFLAAIAAPLMTAATAHFDRRLMLCLFMLLLALANFLAAAAPDYWLVLTSRIMVGITIGGFWSIAAGLAERLVPPASVGRATAVIFSATFIGDLAGWRTAFTVMGALTVGVQIMLLLLVPPLPAVQATRLNVLKGVLRSVNTRFALLLTFLVVLAHFGTYTYVTSFLEQVTHADDGLITTLLLLYGAAGVLGNFLGGSWVARYPRTVFGLAAGLIAAVTLLLPALPLGNRRSDTADRLGHRVWCCASRIADLVLQGGTACPGSGIGPVHRLLPGNDLDGCAGRGSHPGPHLSVHGHAAGRVRRGSHGPGSRDPHHRAPHRSGLQRAVLNTQRLAHSGRRLLSAGRPDVAGQVGTQCGGAGLGEPVRQGAQPGVYDTQCLDVGVPALAGGPQLPDLGDLRVQRGGLRGAVPGLSVTA
jgi:predicted MFS family arabinose efflux permease